MGVDAGFLFRRRVPYLYTGLTLQTPTLTSDKPTSKVLAPSDHRSLRYRKNRVDQNIKIKCKKFVFFQKVVHSEINVAAGADGACAIPPVIAMFVL